MASNVGAAISSFMRTEGKKILQQEGKGLLKQAASGAANIAVGGMGGGRQQQDQIKARTGVLTGIGLLGSGLAPSYITGKIAMGKAQQAATSVASFASKGATPEAGAALQGTVELAKNQINSFTNLFTSPGIKSISDFFNVMADSPNQVMSFGEALLSVTGRLKEVSGTFAALAASREVRQLERDIKTGQQTGGSATRLNEALEDLKDEMLPIQNDLYNTTADLVTDIVPLVSQLYQEIAPWLKASLQILAEILRWLVSVLIPIMISMLTVFEYLLIALMTLQGSWNPLLNALGDAAGAIFTEVQKARKALEEGLEDDSQDDPHRIAVQQLFNAAQNAMNPPKPPKP